MTVDIISISSLDVKESAVALANDVNDKELTIVASSLKPTPVFNQHQSLLMDPVVRLGILIKKVQLKDIFPTPLDIRSFSKQTGSQLRPFNQGSDKIKGDVASFNEKHGSELLNPEHDILNTPTEYPKGLVLDYVTFCRVTGFFDLAIADVNLRKEGEKLTITVVETNNLYGGQLEVLI